MTKNNFYFDIVEETARNLIDSVAPDESDLISEYLSAYRQNPHLINNKDDEELAFEGGEIIITLTPAILTIVQATINFITAEVFKASKEEGSEAIKNKIKKLFNPTPVSSDVAEFNKEQLRKIKQIATKQAIKSGLSKSRAEQIANALISSLSLLK